MTAKPQARVSHSRDRSGSTGTPGSAAVGRHSTANDALAQIDEQHQQAEELSLGAQRIGGAGIAAAQAANIDAAQAPEDQAAEQRAEQIGDERLDAEFQHHGL